MNQNNLPVQNAPSRAALPALQSESILFLREGGAGRSIRDYLALFFKYKSSIIISFLVFVTVGVAMVFLYGRFFYTPKFEAKSLLLVKSGWENESPDLSLEKRGPMISQMDIIASEGRILESRDLKERVIKFMKPENIFPELVKHPFVGLTNDQAALIMFEKNLSVNAGRRGSIIEVSFVDPNPVRAAAVVNQLVTFYIDKRADIYKDPKSVLFLEKKADEYKQKLMDSEERLKAFREETKIIALEEQRSILLNRRSDLVASINGTATQIQEAQEKISELEKQLNLVPKTTTTQGASDRMAEAQSKLLGLQMQETELLGKYKEDNRLIANVRNQIEMVKNYLQQQTGKGKTFAAPADPVYQDIQKQIYQNKVELSALKIRSSASEQQLQDLNAEIQTFEARENRNKELLREVTGNEEKYRTYRQRLEEARIHDELDRQKMTSVSVIEPAFPPLVPVNRPKPFSRLLVMALVASIAASIGLAFLREFLKQGISTPSEAERRLDLPVLVAIPIK